MGSFHLRPPVFVMPSDASLPIIDLTYRLVLEVNRAVVELPRGQRPRLPATRRSRGLRPAGAAGRGALRLRPREAGASGGRLPEDELFTLNGAGKAIRDRLDGQRSLAGVVAALTPELAEAQDGAGERDLLGLVAARRDAAAASLAPPRQWATVASEPDDPGAAALPSPEAGGASPWTSR